MARIAGVDLPRNKRIEIALTYIYGIGRALSRADPEGGRRLARQADRRSRRERDPPHPRRRSNSASCKVEGDLRRDVSMNIKRLMDLGCYRGLRHRKACRCAASARTPTRAPARARARAMISARSRRRAATARRAKSWPTASGDCPKAGPRQAEEEGQEEHPDRHRAHHGDVQQHHRHDHRRLRQRRRVVVGGRAGFKGSRKSTPFAAQLAAEDAAQKAMEHGMRSLTVYVKGPGSGRESALRALQRRPASRSPSSATSRRSRTTVAGRRKRRRV